MPSALRGNSALVGRGDLFKVDPRQIVVRDGWNPRTVFEIEDLKNSIREHGVKTPVRVRLNDEVVELVDGERRLRAVMELIAEGNPIESVLALMEKAGSDADLLVTALITNQGEQLSPIDEAHALQRFIAWGWDVKKIAVQIGKSQSHVYGRLKLLEGSQEIQEALHKGKVTVTEALETVREETQTPKKAAAKKEKTEAQIEKAKQKAHREAVLFDLVGAVEDVILNRENSKHLSDALDILEKALKNYDNATEGTE
jgi:ParB/RepB/Spo0J family partition protein